MVRVLNEIDRENILEFLSEEAAFNLFIIGDIENEGFDKEYQTIWGHFNNSNELTGVLLKHYDYFIVYYNENNKFSDEERLILIAEFKEILRGFNNLNIISGKTSIIENFTDIFYSPTVREEYFCELDSIKKLHNHNERVSIAKVADSKEIYNLRNSINEFKKIGAIPLNRIEKNILEDKIRVYVYKTNDGKIVSTAQTSAENKYSAMILSICTYNDERGKGYATDCVSNLSRDLILSGKKVYLFCANADTCNIYQKLGFKTIGSWSIMLNKFYK